MQNIFIANVPPHVTDSDLATLFAQFGPVNNCEIIRDRETGRPRGFAFVEMEDPVQAAAAIEGLNGQPWGNRQLVVRVAEPKADRRQRQQ